MKSKYLIYLVLLGIIFISGCGPQTMLTPSFSTVDFAKCLTDKGVKMYGATWCEHCNAQKQLFGDAWSSIDYVECSISGSESELNQICIDESIQGLPTWEFKDGNIIIGKQSLLELSQASGCPVPSGPTPPVESGILFVGPQQTLQGTVSQEFSYSFCKPDVAGPGATCGGLEGATTDPTEGKPPYSFEARGILPPGIALNLNGLLAGTPTLEGTYNFGVCAKDLEGHETCTSAETTILQKKEKWKLALAARYRLNFYECKGGDLNVEAVATFTTESDLISFLSNGKTDNWLRNVNGTISSTTTVAKQITVLPQYEGKNKCTVFAGETISVPLKYIIIDNQKVRIETDGDTISLPYVYESPIHTEESNLNLYILSMEITSVSDGGTIISGIFPGDEEDLIRQRLGGTFTLTRIG
ncbi:hypothetical protein HYW20_02665 [Candidatus Woesearchaeota archaeon]|nr:hypothetical protein [Candidatus Woesearchaeota archaeon]